MKRLILSMAVVALAATACKKNADQNFNPRGANAGPLDLPVVTLPNVISEDMILDNMHSYKLDGKVYVDEGVTLYIQEDTKIYGVKKDSSHLASALIITRGAQIFAAGTSTKPVVFTTWIDPVTNPTAEPGDWGGVVILGKATVNKNNPTIEGIDLPTVPAGIDVHYGGTDDGDISGQLEYVRIEYAGAQIATDNELNGLTLGGVGCGTVLDYVQVAYGADDAFEFFGGTVNAKHLYALAPNDDAFDFDFGYRGSIQYAVSVLRNNLSYSANPNGIECDNDATGSNDNPRTKPQISNMTVLGLETANQANGKPILNAAQFRRNSDFLMKNSILFGFPTGLNHNGAGANKHFSHNLVQAWTTPVTPAPYPTQAGCGDLSTVLAFTGTLTAPFASTPDFRPVSGSQPLTAGTNFSCFSAHCTSNYIDSVSYRGAFDATNNWIANWTIN